MNLQNQLLLAMPGLLGDYFAGTLTYLCEHNDEGALGLIINRPSELTLLELLAQLGLPTTRSLAEVAVLDGGPVSTERGYVLHTGEVTFESSASLGNDLYLSTGLDALEAIGRGEGPQHYLVALGYAGWGAGQLEGEMGDNVWLTAPSNQEILFATPYGERQQAAAALLGVDFRLMSGTAGHA